MGVLRFLIDKIGWKGLAKLAAREAKEYIEEDIDEIRKDWADDEAREQRREAEAEVQRKRDHQAWLKEKARTEDAIDDELAALKKRVEK